jgi:hypothetical protein
MAFISEIIPEEQKNKFAFQVATNGDGSRPTLYKWAVDYKRNIFLVLTKQGGGGHQGVPLTQWYVLSWNSEVINFQCESHSSGDISSGQYLLLKVSQLAIPLVLKERKDDVVKLIQEVMTVDEWPYYKKAYVEINVEFDQAISFY